MKFSFKCPKCSSYDVLEVKGTSMNTMTKIPLHKWGLKHAVLDRYLCANCGFTEEYVQLTDSFKRWAASELRKPGKRFDEYV